MTIEPNRYNILKEHNYELKDENAQLKHELDKQKNYNMSHAQIISELKKLNEKSYKPHEVLKFKKQIERLSGDKYKYIELYKQKLDEVTQLKQRISKLVSENTTLQNDLFSEQLLQDEAEDYINKLQQKILNMYR